MGFPGEMRDFEESLGSALKWDDMFRRQALEKKRTDDMGMLSHARAGFYTAKTAALSSGVGNGKPNSSGAFKQAAAAYRAPAFENALPTPDGGSANPALKPLMSGTQSAAIPDSAAAAEASPDNDPQVTQAIDPDDNGNGPEFARGGLVPAYQQGGSVPMLAEDDDDESGMGGDANAEADADESEEENEGLGEAPEAEGTPDEAIPASAPQAGGEPAAPAGAASAAGPAGEQAPQHRDTLLGRALHAALTFLPHVFGLHANAPAQAAPQQQGALPAQQPQDNSEQYHRGVQYMMKGMGAADEKEIASLRHAVDPQGRLEQELQTVVGMKSVVEYYQSIGDNDKASKAAASIVQYMRGVSASHAGDALTAFQHGNYHGAISSLKKAYESTPDGNQVEVQGGDHGQGSVIQKDGQGNVIGKMEFGPQQLLGAIVGMKNGSAFYQHLIQAAGKNLPPEDTGTPALDEYMGVAKPSAGGAAAPSAPPISAPGGAQAPAMGQPQQAIPPASPAAAPPGTSPPAGPAAPAPPVTSAGNQPGAAPVAAPAADDEAIDTAPAQAPVQAQNPAQAQQTNTLRGSEALPMGIAPGEAREPEDPGEAPAPKDQPDPNTRPTTLPPLVQADLNRLAQTNPKLYRIKYQEAMSKLKAEQTQWDRTRSEVNAGNRTQTQLYAAKKKAYDTAMKHLNDFGGDIKPEKRAEISADIAQQWADVKGGMKDQNINPVVEAGIIRGAYGIVAANNMPARDALVLAHHLTQVDPKDPAKLDFEAKPIAGGAIIRFDDGQEVKVDRNSFEAIAHLRGLAFKHANEQIEKDKQPSTLGELGRGAVSIAKGVANSGPAQNAKQLATNSRMPPLGTAISDAVSDSPIGDAGRAVLGRVKGYVDSRKQTIDDRRAALPERTRDDTPAPARTSPTDFDRARGAVQDQVQKGVRASQEGQVEQGEAAKEGSRMVGNAAGDAGAKIGQKGKEVLQKAAQGAAQASQNEVAGNQAAGDMAGKGITESLSAIGDALGMNPQTRGEGTGRAIGRAVYRGEQAVEGAVRKGVDAVSQKAGQRRQEMQDRSASAPTPKPEKKAAPPKKGPSTFEKAQNSARKVPSAIAAGVRSAAGGRYLKDEDLKPR